MKTVQFITHYTEKYSYLDSARMALKGGCRWIQLRMKDAGKEEIVSVAMELRNLCNDCGAIFIIDDHVELVREIGADGVHLGKNDMSVAEARRILGDEYIIGGTANTYEDVKKHWLNGVNYIGCGPFRYTTTKQKLSPILGLEGYKDYPENAGRKDLSSSCRSHRRDYLCRYSCDHADRRYGHCSFRDCVACRQSGRGNAKDTCRN